MRRAFCVFIGASLIGCAVATREDRITRDMSDEVARSERGAFESHTRARLAALERSLNDFIRAEGRIPASLDELVPQYLAEIPEVELGVAGHKDTSAVVYYDQDVISDGQVNGALLRDSGGWGYVFSDRQVVVFIDCTHKRMDGEFWYKARGVY
ncbi:MAG: hypothetical protein ABII00_17240 [Elusimicrobiota bacterium]